MLSEEASMAQPKLTGLAHLVLRVRDLDSSVDFYTRVLGLEVTSRAGTRMAFLSAPVDNGKSHELGLLGLGPDLPPNEQNRVGLYHFAWQLNSIEELEAFHQHLLDEDATIVGYGDHGISIGIYFIDPDANEIEVFYELPADQWPANGRRFDGHFPLPFNVERTAAG